MAKPRRRWLVRLAVFLAVAAVSLPVFRLDSVARLVPALSPLLSGLGALAARHWTWLALLGLPILVLSFFRGCWFCARLCPTGFALEIAGRLNSAGKLRFMRMPKIGHLLALILFGSALFGYPLALWLDPLSMLGGFFSAWRSPANLAVIAPAVGFAVLVLVSVFAPRAWCNRLCPLGATQNMIGALGRLLRRPGCGAQAPAWRPSGRRAFLLALAGGAAALALRRIAIGRSHSPVRPPGSVSEADLGALCARCGNCMAACPTRIIRADLGAGGLLRLLVPEIRFEGGYCDEWCNKCTTVCSTGALQPLSVDEKRNRPIGLAEVTRERCIAWTAAGYCMVCQEFCPYQAVDSIEHSGVPCPVVLPDRCRGCGACENSCPALPRKAIMVRGLG